MARFTKRARLLLAVNLSGLVLIAGGYTLINRSDTARHQLRPAIPKATTTMVATPARLQADSKVAADRPKSLMIAGAGIDGPIEPVGVTADGSMATPNVVDVAGWYNKSVLPGQDGLSIIDGHVSGKTQRGIFFRLARVQTGAVIVVTMGDNSVRHFSVTDTRTYSVNDAYNALYDTNQSGRVLRLITCDGVFDDTASMYDHRVIVTAVAK